MGREFGPVSVRVENAVALVVMADEASGNAISADLRDGLRDALSSAEADPEAHVVVVTGLPNRFCSGATREFLASDSVGSVEPFVRAFAHCRLPVIAAMRGHAIGGGLTLGLYADVAVLSERSMYAANFLNYGLAPSYGTTWVLPARLGRDLGTEMLLTARAYQGAELRARSAPVRVVAHDEVVPVALAEAGRVARAPRDALRLLKRQLASQVLASSDSAIAAEAEPHRLSWESAHRSALVASRYGRPDELRS